MMLCCLYVITKGVAEHFSDGQKIATRLSRQISVVGKMLKKALLQYNSDLSGLCCISWAEAVDLSSSFYHDGLYCDNSTVPIVVKSQAVQLHHRISRCEEEITRLKTDMSNCVDHYVDLYEYLTRCTERLQCSEEPSRICLLKREKTKCISQLKSFESFKQYTELPRLETILMLQMDDIEFCEPEQG